MNKNYAVCLLLVMLLLCHVQLYSARAITEEFLIAQNTGTYVGSLDLTHIHPTDEDGTVSAIYESVYMNYAEALTLSRVSVELNRLLSPVGILVCRLYSPTGTFGVDMEPASESYVAESNGLAMESVTAGGEPPAMMWYDFTFSISFTIQPNTYYCVAIVAKSGTIDLSNYVYVAYGFNSYAGNMGDYTTWGGPSWKDSGLSVDMFFKVYGQKYTPDNVYYFGSISTSILTALGLLAITPFIVVFAALRAGWANPSDMGGGAGIKIVVFCAVLAIASLILMVFIVGSNNAIQVLP